MATPSSSPNPSQPVLGRFSIGIGDRFAHQARAQLQACIDARNQGIDIVPVWNKSNREHAIIGSHPDATRDAAAAAVQSLGWPHAWHVDADHIRLDTVDRFLAACDFFTIDVADAIGSPADPAAVEAFVRRHPELVGSLAIDGIDVPIQTTADDIHRFAAKYLGAVSQAGRIHRHIQQGRPAGFITEVSMDETDLPQTPPELLVILVALADEGVPLQTIAPKFTGRFNKGVDYVGDLARFETEFLQDLAVIRHAVRTFDLPANLKLSVHSGSDKFSLYPVIRRALRRFDAGVHLKTAGTTWLEELIGLAEAGGDGLRLAAEIYEAALAHIDSLCAPYASVIDIDRGRLPDAATVRLWDADAFVAALRHVPSNPRFNPHVRQLLHVGFKIAAGMGRRYLDALEAHEPVISANVRTNLLDRHLLPLLANPAHGADPS